MMRCVREWRCESHVKRRLFRCAYEREHGRLAHSPKTLHARDMKRHDTLTATDYYHYLQCPHWPYWDRFGDRKDRRPLTEAQEERMGDGLEHEKRVLKEEFGGFREVRIASQENGFKRTLELMREGAAVIYQGWLVDGDRVGRPDILERRDGKSVFGDWYYVPMDVKRAHELKKEHKAQLTFYCVLLEKIQGRFPAEPAIINADHDRLPFKAEEFLKEFGELTNALERIRGGEIPDPVFRKTCVDTSPWGDACFRLAKERNDIALLFNVDVKKLKALRNLGVRTVDDAAELDPSELEGKAPGLTLRALQSVQRQAQSLRDEKVIIKKPFVQKGDGLEIHFDIESHPPTDTDYLYGFWIVDGENERGQSFVSERPEDEEKMWKAFLAWLPTLPAHYTVFHYATYEATRLVVLARRYGDSENEWLKRFLTRLVDLKEKTRDSAVFPLYFYSLKKICQSLGFRWEGDVKGGAESIIAYDQWMKTGKRSILESIVQYNEEDVRATTFLLRWLRTYASKETSYAKPYPWTKKS